jgi:hypothetical protein
MTTPLHAWASERLATILGVPDVSDVCEYILGIDDEGELRDFVEGMLPEGGESQSFLKELNTRKAGGGGQVSGSGSEAGTAGSIVAAAQASAKASASSGSRGGGRGEDAAAGMGGARGMDATRAMLNMKSKNELAQEAMDRLSRAAAAPPSGAGAGGKAVQIPVPPSLGQEDGMKAYLKGANSDDDLFGGIPDSRRKKGKGGRGGGGGGGRGEEEGGGGGGGQDAEGSGDSHGNNTPTAGVASAAPRLSRGRRAEMIISNLGTGGGAFLAPGRRLTSWVGNGDDYRLIGNCLDCGKIVCDQEGEGACLVCGSEQVYIASTGCMLDGNPLDVALMNKRRRGGGAGEVDMAVDGGGGRDAEEVRTHFVEG